MGGGDTVARSAWEIGRKAAAMAKAEDMHGISDALVSTAMGTVQGAKQGLRNEEPSDGKNDDEKAVKPSGD